MKTEIKKLQLVEKGLSAKTVSKLTESQINVLYSKLSLNEAIQTKTSTSYFIPTTDADKGATLPTNAIQPGKNITVQKTPTGVKVTPNEEISEDDDFDLDADQAYTDQKGSHDADQPADDGMDDDTSPQNHDSKMIGMSEEKKYGKKNPWAICHAQVGPKKSRKFERCVKEVKKSLKEGKNPVSLFLENQIMNIVERNLPPRITKGDLVKYLTEDGPAVAPSKPKTEPTTKPGKPGIKPQKPAHPLKNPNPGEKPAPKAKKISTDKAKDEVIDLIVKLLKNG